jgi:hypothetical protein
MAEPPACWAATQEGTGPPPGGSRQAAASAPELPFGSRYVCLLAASATSSTPLGLMSRVKGGVSLRPLGAALAHSCRAAQSQRRPCQRLAWLRGAGPSGAAQAASQGRQRSRSCSAPLPAGRAEGRRAARDAGRRARRAHTLAPPLATSCTESSPAADSTNARLPSGEARQLGPVESSTWPCRSSEAQEPAAAASTAAAGGGLGKARGLYTGCTRAAAAAQRVSAVLTLC